jgi:hypothetical protein
MTHTRVPADISCAGKPFLSGGASIASLADMRMLLVILAGLPAWGQTPDAMLGGTSLTSNAQAANSIRPPRWTFMRSSSGRITAPRRATD